MAKDSRAREMLRSVEDFLDKFVTTAGTDYGRDSY
jgi:uncharacterized protein YheU (UPF0270 family)